MEKKGSSKRVTGLSERTHGNGLWWELLMGDRERKLWKALRNDIKIRIFEEALREEIM